MSAKVIILIVVAAVAASWTASHAQSIPAGVSLVWSSPSDGTIDPARVADDAGFAEGITTFELVFDQPVTLTLGNVEVVSTALSSPTVSLLYGRGRRWLVELSEPIPPGETTILSIDRGRILVHVHSHPGDVNGDLVSDQGDVLTMRNAVARSTAYDARFDMDRNGALDGRDVASIQSMLMGDAMLEAWMGRYHAPPLTGQCCCSGTICFVYPAGCPQGMTAGTCPCSSTSCGAIGGG